MTKMTSVMSSDDNSTAVDYLEEPTHAFKLWAYVVIAVTVLVLLSVVFVATVKACRSGRKRRMHMFHTTVTPTRQSEQLSIT